MSEVRGKKESNRENMSETREENRHEMKRDQRPKYKEEEEIEQEAETKRTAIQCPLTQLGSHFNCETWIQSMKATRETEKMERDVF